MVEQSLIRAKGKPDGKQPEKEVILKLISGAVELKLDSCDGKKTIAYSKKVFNWIGDNFKKYGANTTGTATKETIIEVFEVIKDAMFTKMFGSLSSDLDKLCLTQSQILNFVTKYKNWLCTKEYATFFLFKSGEAFFVVSIYFYNVSYLGVTLDRFGDESIWGGKYRLRIVVPQLTV